MEKEKEVLKCYRAVNKSLKPKYPCFLSLQQQHLFQGILEFYDSKAFQSRHTYMYTLPHQRDWLPYTAAHSAVH